MGPREFLASLETFGIKLGLANISALSAALGAPHHAFQTVHIAGTNGKGSVAAMCEAALRRSGLRTGRYTSPHLVRLEERVAIDGEPVSSGALDDALGEVQQVTGRLRAGGALEVDPTYFEATTAAAFAIFRRRHVDVAVVEVGLGGRFDATNIVDPIATAITAVAFDHEAHLGRTLAQIAYEKAGIIKPGRPVVVGRLDHEALEVVRATCAERGAPLIEADRGCEVQATLESGRTILTLRTPRRAYGPLRLGLRGRHQVDNAVVAVRLLETLEATGLRVDASSVAPGLEQVHWPARLDLRDCGGGRQVLIDGAHNPAGAAALAAFVEETWPEGLPVVFGAMGDKDLAGMLRPLLPLARPLILTLAPGRRAADAAELTQLARSLLPHAQLATEPDPLAAVELGWSRHPLVCVAGSLYLAGFVLAGLGLEPPARLG